MSAETGTPPAIMRLRTTLRRCTAQFAQRVKTVENVTTVIAQELSHTSQLHQREGIIKVALNSLATASRTSLFAHMVKGSESLLLQGHED